MSILEESAADLILYRVGEVLHLRGATRLSLTQETYTNEPTASGTYC